MLLNQDRDLLMSRILIRYLLFLDSQLRYLRIIPAFFLGSDLKNMISYEKKKLIWLNSAFPLILYIWIRKHVPK